MSNSNSNINNTNSLSPFVGRDSATAKFRRFSGKILRIAGLLILAIALASCNREDEKNSLTKGTISGYHKCNDFENGSNGSLVFGIYIVTDKKDTLLSYNIPHETLSSLLGDANLANFEQGSLYFRNREISPIIFDYREAEEHEIITIACPQQAFYPAFNGENAKQVIIAKINKEEIK